MVIWERSQNGNIYGRVPQTLLWFRPHADKNVISPATSKCIFPGGGELAIYRGELAIFIEQFAFFSGHREQADEFTRNTYTDSATSLPNRRLGFRMRPEKPSLRN